MAGSRLERIGTIFSRVTGLLQSKAMAIEDRPIWYEVYKAFPPKLPPRYDRPASDEPIREIFYPEDVIRARFHKHMGRKLPMINLSDKETETLTQKMINRCNKLQSENQSFDDVFNSALQILAAESAISLTTSQQSSERKTGETIVDSFRKATSKKPNTPIEHVNIKSIFQDDK